MTVRSVTLFAHVVGMLMLFGGLALEWGSVQLRALPRYMAIAVGLILATGIYLSLRVGVFALAWVRLSFALMLVMGVLGGPVTAALRRRSSGRLLRASLQVRTAIGLAIVNLMIGKPELDESLLLIALALAAGGAASVKS
jgi:hypothetical protein